MADVNSYPPPPMSPGFQPQVGYNNQAFQPNGPDGFAKPPPYMQQPQPQPYPPPQPGPVGYYPAPAPMVGAPQPYLQQQQNQQTTTVVVNAAQTPIIVQQPAYQSYCGMIVFACFVLWFCNALFGFIAFILAVVAESNKDGDPNGARKLGKASMWMSIVGIIVTVVIIAIAVGVGVGTAAQATSYSRYVSPYTCCSSHGYVYPGYGSYCYGSVNSYYYGSCPGYYYSSTCYSYSYSLSFSLCCYSSERSYSVSSSTCYR